LLLRKHPTRIGLQDGADQPEISPAYLPPTPRQARLALAGAATLLLGLAVLAPFAAKPLPQVNGFVPALDAIIFVTDLITASLLLAHFSITRSSALLALACGYLFSALIVVAHGLSFPGVFSPTGNLGGSSQTTIRLYLSWHLGFPTALFAYVWFKDQDRAKVGAHSPTALLAVCSVVGIFALVSCVVWLAVAGDGFLPPALVDPGAAGPVMLWLIAFTMLISAAALSVMWVFQRSALDQWLMVVMLASIVELAITALFGGTRFTLGFYTGRVFSLVTSTFVLIALLAETTRLYANVARANMLARALKAEAELVHANRIATMGQLAASIAHEVAHPIAATLLNADTALRWLAREPPNLERTKQSIDRIIDDGKRAADILGRILDFSKKTPAGKDDVEVNEAILEIMKVTRTAMSEHRVLAKTQLSNGLPRVPGDRVRLQQVMLNLIMNAIEAMSDGREGPRELSIATRMAESGAVFVAVSDTGPGLNPASLTRIFEAFYTTKASGLGMGLSICRSIVEAHGGRIWAAANEPHGAIFCVTLPIGERARGQQPIKA
jgi:signal transduction histidine kinase